MFLLRLVHIFGQCLLHRKCVNHLNQQLFSMELILMQCLSLLNSHIHVKSGEKKKKEHSQLSLFESFLFVAEITICENNVQPLLTAASLLMMQSVRDACSSFFERFLDETNAIGINCFAELHGTQELTKKAKRFVLKRFSQVLCELLITILKAKEKNSSVVLFQGCTTR